MASIFSDHYNSSGTVAAGQGALAEELAFDSQRRPAKGLKHARGYWSRGEVLCGTIAGIGDEIRFFDARSGDRLLQLFVVSDGGCTAGAMDIGLYKSGRNGDGAVIDADLFASALAVSSAIAFVDEFKEATTLGDVDRGKTLWELAAVGAGSDTVDPMDDYAVVGTVTTAFTVAVCRLLVFAHMVAH